MYAPRFTPNIEVTIGRETRLYQTAPISTNMILAYIAQHVLGLPRSY